MIGGGIVGLLLPLIRWKLGAALVGILVAIPFFTAIAFSLAKSAEPLDWVTIMIASVVLGVPTGIGYRQIFWEDLPESVRRRRGGTAVR